MEWFTDSDGQILLGSEPYLTAGIVVPSGIFLKENRFFKKATDLELRSIGDLDQPRNLLIPKVKKTLLDNNPIVQVYSDDRA